MSAELESVFMSLKTALTNGAPGFHIASDTPVRFELDASPGPATLAAWGGKLRRPRIPIAWITMAKDHVSYHLMPLDHPTVRATLSKPLQTSLRGKTCLVFRAQDEGLFRELEEVTARGLAAFRKAGFITEPDSV